MTSIRRFPWSISRFPRPRIPTSSVATPAKAPSKLSFRSRLLHLPEWTETNWKRRGEDYDALKQRLTDRLQAELERQVPSVAGNIDCMELSTPITTRHFMNYRHGEIYGFSATPQRYAIREIGARTPIRGLFLTGQDVTTLGVVGRTFRRRNQRLRHPRQEPVLSRVEALRGVAITRLLTLTRK